MSAAGYTRKKRGFVRATITPQTGDAGKGKVATAEIVPRSDEEDALLRYLEAKIEYRARAYAERQNVDCGLRALAASKQAARRARRELERQGHEADADLVDEVVTSHGELLAEDLAHACEPMRPYVRAVAREFVAGYLEKRPQTSDDVDLLMAKARARAGARALWRSCLRIGLASPSMTRTVKHQDGSTVQTKMPSGSELMGRMAALDEVALRASLTLDARITAQRSKGGIQITPEWQAKLERVLTQEATAHAEARKQLEARLASTVEVSNQTVTRGVVTEPLPEQTPVARGASPAPPRTAPAPSPSAPAPSPPAPSWTAPREDPETARLAGMSYDEARRLVMGQWYGAEQNASNKWDASGRRGHRPMTPRTIPYPLSKWLRSDLPNEVAWAETRFGWAFEKESNG